MKRYCALIIENVVSEIIVGDYVWANNNLGGEWVDCTTNGELIVGIGYTYLESEQDFRSPQPYPSWTWANKTWNPPTPYPNDNKEYKWSEEELEWVAI